MKKIMIVDDNYLSAEGIEKKEWCQKMNEMQVDYLQGYLIGKPLPLTALET